MQKYLLLIPILLAAACAEKNISSESSALGDKARNTSFFMTRPQAKEPVELVVDKKYVGRKPLHYRANKEHRYSGSASYQPQALREIARPVGKKKNLLYIFDLRQESHGYINDEPVTWQAENDWANADLTHDEVIRRERRLLGDMRVGDKINGVEIKSIETEESTVRSANHQYVRLTVTDHVRPTDNEVDRFVAAVKALPEDAWVHFHCRAGKGRTTTFMTMFEMLKTAPTDSFESIVERVKKLSDGDDVMFIGEPSDWKYVYQKERAEFLRNFYQYAKAHPKMDEAWSSWSPK